MTLTNEQREKLEKGIKGIEIPKTRDLISENNGKEVKFLDSEKRTFKIIIDKNYLDPKEFVEIISEFGLICSESCKKHTKLENDNEVLLIITYDTIFNFFKEKKISIRYHDHLNVHEKNGDMMIINTLRYMILEILKNGYFYCLEILSPNQKKETAPIALESTTDITQKKSSDYILNVDKTDISSRTNKFEITFANGADNKKIFTIAHKLSSNSELNLKYAKDKNDMPTGDIIILFTSMNKNLNQGDLKIAMQQEFNKIEAELNKGIAR